MVSPPDRPSPAHVSTGDLPSADAVLELVADAHQRFASVSEGAVADYIPILADASADWFGICIVSVAGRVAAVGDTDQTFSIQSISKPFVFALVCDAVGPAAAREALGVNNTGLPFNSVMAIELNDGRPMNPMVNAGAIATTSLAPGGDARRALGVRARGPVAIRRAATLELDEAVYHSESSTNLRNQGIAHLLDGYGQLHADPDETVDVYTKQCSLLVSARDLAVMGATLADGGVNPLTGERVVDAATVPAGAGRARHLRALRAQRRLALRLRTPGQERRERRHRHRLARQGRSGRLLPSPRRGRQQRARPARHAATSPKPSVSTSSSPRPCERNPPSRHSTGARRRVRESLPPPSYGRPRPLRHHARRRPCTRHVRRDGRHRPPRARARGPDRAQRRRARHRRGRAVLRLRA